MDASATPVGLYLISDMHHEAYLSSAWDDTGMHALLIEVSAGR